MASDVQDALAAFSLRGGPLPWGNVHDQSGGDLHCGVRYFHYLFHNDKEGYQCTMVGYTQKHFVVLCARLDLQAGRIQA